MRFLKKLLKTIEVYQQKRADYLILQRFSDRELHDIGLGRSQIKEVIYGKESDGETTKVS
jgi:uncharacterized protein YjiS (DUF1127 family)